MNGIDFAKLAAPIPSSRVKSLTKKYKDKNTGEHKQYTISFITARTVMNRLDGVVGPANWRDSYETRADGNVVCTLFIRIDGEWVGKSDVGTETDIEEDKGAFSDAFKRAGVKWGIGRELHGDGTVYEHLRQQQAPEDTTPTQHVDAATETPDDDAPASDDTPFPAQHDRADTTREPETRDAHSEAPPAAQPSDYDPAIDTRVFTQHTWTHLNGWMVRTMDNIDKSIHAVNALWKSLEEHADRLYDNADRVELFKQVVVDKKSFKHLYAANLTVAQVWNAIAAHYYGELADAA